MQGNKLWCSGYARRQVQQLLTSGGGAGGVNVGEVVGAPVGGGAGDCGAHPQKHSATRGAGHGECVGHQRCQASALASAHAVGTAGEERGGRQAGQQQWMSDWERHAYNLYDTRQVSCAKAVHVGCGLELAGTSCASHASQGGRGQRSPGGSVRGCQAVAVVH